MTQLDVPTISFAHYLDLLRRRTWHVATVSVLGLVIGGEARAYPLRVLIWHEIANDTLGGVPVAVTFCPLCNTAIVFDRRHDGQGPEPEAPFPIGCKERYSANHTDYCPLVREARFEP